jgi:hypothetical protein
MIELVQSMVDQEGSNGVEEVRMSTARPSPFPNTFLSATPVPLEAPTDPT